MGFNIVQDFLQNRNIERCNITVTSVKEEEIIIDLRDMMGYCSSCNNWKPMHEIGMQTYEDNVIRKQPYCKSCRK